MQHLLTWRRCSSGLGLIILLAAAAGCSPSSSQPASSYPPIDDIPCETIERVAFHIHAHLAIYAQGQAQTVPYGIGIGQPWRIQSSSEGPFVVAGACFYWLHTHTEDGIIHIESPQQRTFTLGDFFAIWGEPLSSSQVGANHGPVIAYVNGEQVAGDPGQILLQAHALIQLDVADTTPPQPFRFPEGL
jgi:hypothetical protein